MNYYGGPGTDKSGLYPGANYPGATFGLPQPSGLSHGHPQAAGMTPGLTQHAGLTPGHAQPTTVPSFASAASTQAYTAYPGMAPGQSIYTTTGYSVPQGYPSAMNGSAGLTSMGAFYSSPHVTTLPYSTLQPIPQATPSIPSVASLPSVPAVPHIPSIQPTQSGYPASHRQHPLSSAYLHDPLAAKQQGYPIGSNPLMQAGMPSASVPGMPHGYQAGGGVPTMGYPNPSVTNAYAGMPGVRVAPHTGHPYGPRY